MPLSAHSLRKFDVEAAREWFFQTEGLPYGYHNFLFSWLDTERDNLPPILPNEFLPILAYLLSGPLPEQMKIMVFEAMNKRLGTENLTLPQLAAESARRHMTL